MANQEKSLNITWSQFEVCNPDTRASFENMCRFLFNALFFDGKGIFHSDPNNPGIEIVPILHEESGQRISFQAKYFGSIDYAQIKHSAEKAIQYYAGKLDAIYLYCNKDLTISSKSYQDIFNMLSSKSIALIPITNQAILDQVLRNDTVLRHYFDYSHPKSHEDRLQLQQKNAIKFTHNQKSSFISKWNEELFLHKGTGIKLYSLYQMPNFLINGQEESDLNKVFDKFLLDSDKNIMIVLGNPGLGKSSLMSYWANKYQNAENYVFIKMFELEPDKANESLLYAIIDFLECKQRDLQDAVLFLDGYDELRVDNRHYELCLKLISEIYSVPGLKVVMSSRLNYIDLDKNKFDNDFHCVDTVVLMPLIKGQMIEYIKNFDQAVGNEDKGKINQFSNISTEKEIFGIPFILYLVCALNLNIENIQNIFNLYEKVFAFNGGLYDKIYDKNAGHYLTRNPQNKRELLLVSKLFALEMFKNRSGIEISKEAADRILSAHCPNRKTDFAIGNYYNIETNRIMFVHKTFGEYFFIKYVIELLEETPRLSNEQIMLKFWDTYQQNYMYKRLENLLELALVLYQVRN